MKSKKFFAALLAGALTLGVVPFTRFNADINNGSTVIISPDKDVKLDEKEDLNPSESHSEPIVRYSDSKTFKIDQQELLKAAKSGYISVPEDPTKPIRAVSEEEIEGPSVTMDDAADLNSSANPGSEEQNSNQSEEQNSNQQEVSDEKLQQRRLEEIGRQDLDDPGAHQPTSALIDVATYRGKKDGKFGFLSFQTTTAPTNKKIHYTTKKSLKGKRDTNSTVYCLQIHKNNPPSDSEMNYIGKLDSKYLYLIRLGYPRGHRDYMPKEIRDCFYTKKDGGEWEFWNYYITQAAIWACCGDTTAALLDKGTPEGGAPKDINKRIVKFINTAPKYGEEWAVPKIWVNHKKVEAVLDKDPAQYSTPAYELDVDAMGNPKHCLKLMEKNVYTDANPDMEKPPAMEMTFPGGAPKGLRVLVHDKREKKDRVYEVDKGKPPLLYAQDQFRFIMPKPAKAGSFKYKISGPYWTWRAYRYKCGSYQEMGAEDIVEYGEKLTTEGEIFWDVPDTPPTAEKLYSIQVKKVDEKTGQALPGAEFELTKPNNEKEKQIAENGEVIWENLKEGKYTVTETKAPDGYILPPNASQVVTLPPDSGKTVTVTFKDQPRLPDSFPIKVVKKDSADKKPLQGAEFTLTKPDGNKETGNSNVDGSVIFDNLTLTGKYIIEETKAPEGYELAKNPKQEIEVKDAKNPPTAEFEFLNDKIPNKGRVELLKTDAVTNKPLEGVEFALYKKASAKPGEDEKPVEDMAKPGEDEKPVEENQTPNGEENQTPNGEENQTPNGEEQQRKASEETQSNESATKPDENDEQKPNEDSAKPGEENQNQVPGDEVQKPEENQTTSADGVLVGNFTTNAEGKIVVENLDSGDYYFIETKGLEGYKVDKSKLEFTIPGEGGTIQLTKNNIPNDASVEITKTDVSTGEVLAGAKIKIYAEDKTTVLHEGVTDSSGKFAFGPLKPGKYYYQESGAPAGYILDDTLHEFEIKNSGEIVKCTLTNKPEEKPIKGKLEITKVDISTGKPLANAHFAIYDENKNQIMKGVTDSNGIATFELGAGKYYYQEYDAPIGYQLDNTLFPFEIKTDGEIVKCRMTNVTKPVPMLPTTGANIAVGGSLVAAIGAIASALFKRWM